MISTVSVVRLMFVSNVVVTIVGIVNNSGTLSPVSKCEK